MGFFKRVAGLLGFGNHDLHEVNKDDVNGNNDVNPVEEIYHRDYSNLPRKGFSVPVQVPVDRAHQIGPVLVPCAAGDGGVQGLGWYARRLKIDEDGDVADEFLDEIFPASNTEVHHNQFPRFEVKLNTKSAKARNPRLSREGTVQQYVEFGGRLQLV
ncbi:uncharacterized protein LOC112522208 [Cynara cardunculus var. scolymus]|uniref:Uncharacterized protein n=1 Tax=Cynara cardunculus var. scolymus TaxID=59895 RepID=A0A124SB71_CYNCS|nr:uncharacterized protein LOC112522208 [Cynara cardunculus var. scolymus]KVH89722.1 hypothetical protein Ccrd_008285 [Cynara cardunculus var. scolymus]